MEKIQDAAGILDFPFYIRTVFNGESAMVALERNDISFESFERQCK